MISPKRLISLNAVCARPSSKSIATPFQCEVWGKKWTAATNRQGLAMIEDETAELRVHTPDVAKVFPAKFVPTWSATLKSLRDWAGAVQWEECENCAGDGEEPCRCPNCDEPHRCTECEGDKFWLAWEDWGDIGSGVYVNPNLLGAMLLSAPEEGDAQIDELRPGAPVVLRAGDWAGMVMPRFSGTPDQKGAAFSGLVAL